MRKMVFVVGVFMYMLALGMETAYAQQIGSGSTIFGNEVAKAMNIVDFLPGILAEPVVTLPSDAGTDALHTTPKSVIVGGAQSGTNWLSLELIIGDASVNIRYERDINDLLSIGGVIRFNFWRNSVSDSDWRARLLSLGAMLSFRIYPFIFPFYFELGVGGDIVSRYNVGMIGDSSRFEFTIVPAFGARFGGAGGFFVSPFISLPVVFFDDWVQTDIRQTSINVRAGAGLGWAW